MRSQASRWIVFAVFLVNFAAVRSAESDAIDKVLDGDSFRISICGVSALAFRPIMVDQAVLERACKNGGGDYLVEARQLLAVQILMLVKDAIRDSHPVPRSRIVARSVMTIELRNGGVVTAVVMRSGEIRIGETTLMPANGGWLDDVFAKISVAIVK